jgi:hypothetical protein
MADKPVWMERWEYCLDNARDVGIPHYVVAVERSGIADRWSLRIRTTLDSADNEDVARLAAAAPALVRALLSTEWARYSEHDPPEYCAACRRPGPAHADGYPVHEVLKDAGFLERCPVDAALTLAGFDTQASRDAARERMRAK